MSSSIEILREAFFDTDHVLIATDEADQYTAGFSYINTKCRIYRDGICAQCWKYIN